MARVIEGVDREVLRQLRHDLLKEIKLRAQCMEKHEARPPAGPDVPKLVAANIDVVDRDLWRPAQGFWYLRDWPQRFDDVGHKPQSDGEANENNEGQCEAHSRTLLTRPPEHRPRFPPGMPGCNPRPCPPR